MGVVACVQGDHGNCRTCKVREAGKQHSRPDQPERDECDASEVGGESVLVLPSEARGPCERQRFIVAHRVSGPHFFKSAVVVVTAVTAARETHTHASPALFVGGSARTPQPGLKRRTKPGVGFSVEPLIACASVAQTFDDVRCTNGVYGRVWRRALEVRTTANIASRYAYNHALL